MKKHPKTAFGILEDGKTIKLASLVRDAYQVYLMDLQRVELDKPLYRPQDELTDFEGQLPEEPLPEIGELNLDELDTEFSSGMKVNPVNRMLDSVGLEYGVISLNVSEDHIVKGSSVPETKRAEKIFVRNYLSARQYKAGEWQTSRVSIGGISQFWLHLGFNQLLELLRFYGTKVRKRLYFQLADSNDIALADFYRIYYLADNLRVLLLYLGVDYRKAYLFDKGVLVDVYPLNITQELPEAELIFSRVSLAMDNVQQAEPEMIVICGDLASEAVVNHFNEHNAPSTTLLTYPLLAVDSTKTEQFGPALMAQFALPIALAYKGLFPDEPRFTPSNFLPHYLLESQKPFKFAWHGFLIMIAIFFMALGGTLSYLHGHSLYTKVSKTKRNLDHELAVLKVETQEIARMRAEIQKFGENLEAVRTVLKGKNPWTEVLDTLDRLFQARPVSWLTNLKKENNRLHISGITTKRSYVIDFADALPNSRIQKVTNGKIHNSKVWYFEITSDFPEVDWVGQIEAEMAAIMEQNRINEAKIQMEEQAAKDAQAVQDAKIAKELAVKDQAAKELAAKKEQAAKLQAAKETASKEQAAKKEQTAKKEQKQTPPPAVKTAPPTKPIVKAAIPAAQSSVTKLSPIGSKYQPKLTDAQKVVPDSSGTDYNAFIDAINGGSGKEARNLGARYIAKYTDGLLIPMVRWHLANRLYNDGDYVNAIEVLDPLVHKVDRYYPYAVLLAARIDFASHKTRYTKIYESLRSDYPKHPIRELVDADLAIIGKGGVQ